MHLLTEIKKDNVIMFCFNLRQKRKMWNSICVGFPRLLMTAVMVVLEVMNAIQSICFAFAGMVP